MTRRRSKLQEKLRLISGEAVSHPPLPQMNSAEEHAIAPVVDSTAIAPVVDSAAIAPVVDSTAVDSSETAANKTEELAGYIFMCSGRTKPECYVNRVFGLPVGKKEIVEKIKAGAKLFLYDYTVRFLYGVYEAETAGGMNLQSTAFGGKFPAQVQFKICNDCLPVPLYSFKTAIKDNFQGAKFTQELNDQQVKDLLLLFKPIDATSSATLPPPAPNPADGQVQPPEPVGAPRHRDRARARKDRRKSSVNPHVKKPYQPYMGRRLHTRSQHPNGPRFVQENRLNPHPHPHPHHQHPSATHQALPAHVNAYQFAENQRSYFYNDHPVNLHEPYPRYMTTHEVHPRAQTVGFNGGYASLASQTTMNHIGTSHGHNPYPAPAPAPAPAPVSFYGSTSDPYSRPTYVYPQQPSVPVSSYWISR